MCIYIWEWIQKEKEQSELSYHNRHHSAKRKIGNKEEEEEKKTDYQYIYL